MISALASFRCVLCKSDCAIYKTQDSSFRSSITLIFVVLTSAGTLVMMRISSKPVLEAEVETDVKNKMERNKKPTQSFTEKFWKGLAVQENLSLIFTAPLPTNSLASVNGFRAVAIIWTILTHVYLYTFVPMENLQLMIAFGDLLLLQPFYAGIIVVDIFLVVAGFLLTFRFFEELKTRNPEVLLCATLKKLVVRYISLIPAIGTVRIFKF